MEQNPLVDPRSTLDPNEYLPTAESPSPLTEGDSWTAGTGLYSDVEQTVQSIKDSDLVGTAFGGGAASLDLLSILLDPVGNAATMLAGWMMEHIKPLHMLLDSLAGNAEVIKGRSATWKNVSEQLADVGSKYSQSVEPDTSQWQGQAGDAYRATARKISLLVTAGGKLAEGMSVLITAAGELCATARQIVHLAISELVGRLLVWASEEYASFGYATPVVVTQALVEAGRVSDTVTDTIKQLVERTQDAIKLASQLQGLLSHITEILREIPGASGAGKTIISTS